MESSLRSRPSQAPRRPAPKREKTILPPRQADGANKSRVDDKIKRRMSRYADISSPTGLDGVPVMPNLAAMMPGGTVLVQEGDEELRDRSLMEEGARIIGPEEKKLLNSDDFDPDAFLKLKLANSTEAELQSLQSSLRNAKEETSSELQRNVFKNYAEFVLISKEISVLENEMLELKDLLSEYKSMPSTLHIPDPTSSSSSLLSTYKRSSVADLRILYFNQMQTLHASIEGASKFVPTTPGRHVVGEMEGVLSLNAATYKVVGKVKFVVLDDAVLVARRRRRNRGGAEGTGSTVNEGKLVAERCWPLNEMLVLDTKDSPSMTNVFKIRHGKETHVYRTESPADKKILLSQFRQVAEELASKKRKEREGEHERRKSMWQAGAGDRNSGVPPMPEWMADLARKGGDLPGTGTDAKEKAERDARWVGDWADELTVAISLRQWTKAVELVEKGQAKLPTIPLLTSKLPGLIAQLTSSLLASLSLPSNRKSTVVSLIALLSRLRAGAAARSTFLDMRSQVIHGLMRKIRFEGHIGAYVADLAVVYFTGIKHTADWYLASFKENEVASAFISWAKQQIEDYAEMFRKQVYSSDVDPKVVEEAVNITYMQSKKLLQEYGLDFRFLLDELLREKPQKFVEPPPLFSMKTQQTVADSGKQRESESPPLQPAPPPPTISAPPPSRRQGPPPTKVASVDALQPPPSASLQPPPSAGLKTGGSVASVNSQHSDASVYTENTAMSARPPYTSGYPGSALNRSRTPVSAAQQQIQQGGGNTPVSAPIPIGPLASPLPRRARSPPLSATPFRSVTPGTRDKERNDDLPRARERPPRSQRGSPAPRSPAPPPRSANRPGSSVGQRPTPIAVPPREGMF